MSQYAPENASLPKVPPMLRFLFGYGDHEYANVSVNENF